VTALSALLGATVLGIVVAVQTTLACTDKMALPMPGGVMAAMPGMDMGVTMRGPMSHAIMVCPVVLALIVASVLLSAAALAMWWRDPHRGVSQRAIVRALVQLPPARTAGALALAGGGAVATMLWLERSGPPAVPVCAMLLSLLLVCSLSATLFGIIAARVALALGRRLILAVVTAFAAAGAAAPCPQRLGPVVAGGHAVPLLAAGRGLRAPPSFVR